MRICVFFGTEMIAQFRNNKKTKQKGNKRSVFTLIIYLNDDFEGGETAFYWPKNPER